ncbi:hypothetical protein [Nocardioides caldifontis]|uniref:hypothetical protein n=1 Tax=Nocardioides caldifontis TaxID=2588938 RepID=UPI0011E023B4|nr:hypothetical protein [Nocardioides caldifontis]
MRVFRPRPRTATPRRALARTGAVAAAAALLLSGCGSTAPGVAAQVDGQRITDEQVDDFAEVLCALGGLPGTASGTPTTEARYNALSILLVTELARQVGDVGSVDSEDLAAAKQQMTAGRDQVPEDARDTFDEVAGEYLESQFALIELGRDSLEEQGRSAEEITDDQAFQEGERLLQEHAAEIDIEVDPRYGRLQDGALVPDDGSLSVPVSEFARSAAEAQPTEELVSQLPSSQKCG